MRGKIFREYGYFLRKAASLPFGGIFTEEIEEEKRTMAGPNGGKREEAANTPDMETLIDMRRLIRIGIALIGAKKNGKGTKGKSTSECWKYFHPAPQDLTPFHAIMGCIGDDYAHPGFSSRPFSKARVMYHRGGKRFVRPKKDVFT